MNVNYPERLRCAFRVPHLRYTFFFSFVADAEGKDFVHFSPWWPRFGGGGGQGVGSWVEQQDSATQSTVLSTD
jgi:hypothetical protein